MQGNCTKEPPSGVALQLAGPELLPRRPNQCLLVVSGDTLDVASGHAWFDNLYFRVRSTGADGDPAVLTAHQFANLWMTGITVQGDSMPGARALVAAGAPGVYAADCVFDSLGGAESVVHTQGTPAAFERCAFTNNLEDGRGGEKVAVVAAENSTAPVLLQGCSLEGNNGLQLRSSGGAKFYSDNTALRCGLHLLVFVLS